MGGEGEGVLASKRVSGAGSMRSTPAISLRVTYTFNVLVGKERASFVYTFLYM